jgi:hypothetical protein
MGNVQEKGSLVDLGTHDLTGLQNAGNLLEFQYFLNVENQSRILLMKTKYSLGTQEQVQQ